MVRAPEHTELETLLMKRVWALEEALMSLVRRDGFEYVLELGVVPRNKCPQELLDSLPWLVGK